MPKRDHVFPKDPRQKRTKPPLHNFLAHFLSLNNIYGPFWAVTWCQKLAAFMFEALVPLEGCELRPLWNQVYSPQGLLHHITDHPFIISPEKETNYSSDLVEALLMLVPQRSQTIFHQTDNETKWVTDILSKTGLFFGSCLQINCHFLSWDQVPKPRLIAPNFDGNF